VARSLYFCDECAEETPAEFVEEDEFLFMRCRICDDYRSLPFQASFRKPGLFAGLRILVSSIFRGNRSNWICVLNGNKYTYWENTITGERYVATKSVNGYSAKAVCHDKWTLGKATTDYSLKRNNSPHYPPVPAKRIFNSSNVIGGYNPPPLPGVEPIIPKQEG